MSAPSTIVTASWVYPMDAPPLRDGAFCCEKGVITDFGPATVLLQRHHEAEHLALPGHTVLPGLVNAHVHLELSSHIPGPSPSSFVDWLISLMSKPVDVAESVRIGVEQCLRFGVTAVGDISRQCAVTRPLLKSGPLRVVSYGELQAMAQRRHLLDERLKVAEDRACESDVLHVDVSPHAPYSIERTGYRRALETRLPLATHLAETPDEAIFLAVHSGEFRRLWSWLNAWDEDVPRFVGGPIRYAKSLGLLDGPTLLAHVNYCEDEELELLAMGKASVVYCPRTHAYFGHPPHRWREMLASGINVAVGTDSCASSPDLNLLDDLRLLHRIAPEVAVETLFEMATVNAAKAIGMSSQVGSLSIGKKADFVAFKCEGLQEVLDDAKTPQTWVAGQVVT